MRRPSAHAPSALWLVLLAAILSFFAAHVGRTWDFTVDDAGISFSYARNIAAGHGIVLTPGSERVEAATNFLWVLALTPADALGVSHETFAKVLGLLCAAGALVALAFFPSVAYRRRPAYYDLVAPLSLATMAHVALWTASGLENGLFQLLAVVSLVLVAWEEHEPERFPWSSLTLAALFATRPDGMLYAFAVAGAKLLRAVTSRASRQDVVWLLTLGLSVGSLELFRLAYFAWPWPNSFYTKKRTFEFGKDLTDFDSAGWQYVRRWVQEYKLQKALVAVPFVLLGLRAPVARLALVGLVAAGFFFPVYSHGDWMEEWRFLTLVAPFLCLGVAEGARALARVLIALSPSRFRSALALALTPVVAYFVIAETTRSYPARFEATRRHDTLDFSTVRGRARYFAAAARLLEVRDGSVLDPDVGGMSYDSGLRVVDLFGLGDIAIAHSHPVDEPGMREAIFWERRPTFVHLHGAWFGAVMLDRLEELDHLYFRLPGTIEREHEFGTNYVRRDLLAAPWNEQAERGPALPTPPAARVEGYTLSAAAIDPGQNFSVELTLANLAAGEAGSVTLVPRGRAGVPATVVLHPGADLVPYNAFLPGERPRARARFRPPTGTYEVRWTGGGAEAVLGTVTVLRGAGARDARAARDAVAAAVRAGRLHEARRRALGLVLRVFDNPDDAVAREGLALYGRALANVALTLGARGAYAIAADAARQARLFSGDDGPTTVSVQRLAEELAERSRDREASGQLSAAFLLARDAVLIDPRRSWLRRRAEQLRARRLAAYDGGRDSAAYRSAVAALAGTGGGAPTVEQAVTLLGSVERWVEASTLSDRAGLELQAPAARLAAARGYLIRGEVPEALRLVAGLPCATARDPELSLALRALRDRPHRPGDRFCELPLPPPSSPLNDTVGSFERGTWAGWTVTGRAFGAGPVHDGTKHQTFINGWRGHYFASSFARDTDALTGTLRSSPFQITTDGISFLIAGGGDDTVVGVRLVVDGQPVLRAAGNASEGLRRTFWDVRPWRGRAATLEVYDQGEGGWGHIVVDDFRAEPVLPAR